MNSILKKLAVWTVCLAFLAGLIFGVPRALAYFLKTAYPLAAITTDSMAPALEPGDLVFVKGVKDKGNIKTGDIIVYRSGKNFVAHRVIRVNRDAVITKGDANKIVDWPVDFRDVVGKALEFNGNPLKIPYLGNISIILNVERSPNN